MACMSGGISFSSMKQPPLLKQIKSILSEYPDGGQILKELIQNAEDAEASEVRILYDGRHINRPTSGTDPKYNKFFMGPALCVYNDAQFTEEDWEGIQMIYSSVKEANPLKVGRFGLGFKSVFHITDYPCLLSSDRLLMIDPQQPTELVNAMVPLSKIGSLENEGLSAEALWGALEGTFGLTRESCHNGTFTGTLFWFPLRERKSALSETLYDEAKIKDLFDGFQHETSSILLFLKNLEKISIWFRGDERKITQFSMVEIDDSNGIISRKRDEFRKKIRSVTSDFDQDDIQNDIPVKILVKSAGKSRTYDWHVVNYFVCKGASKDFMELIKDTNLGYSPYVGVAASLNESAQFHGHVFCFLPLPREGSSLTGLPVHVNGFFALSQNRHHLKLETDEQEGKQIDDKAILWNKVLIKEAFPKAYAKLIEVLIERSTHYGNTDESVGNVYSCLPLYINTKPCWTMLEVNLFEKLTAIPFLFSRHTNSWILLSNASFATFRELPDRYKYVQKSVVKCLDEIGKCYIQVSIDQFITFQKHFSQIHDLSPKLLAAYLHEFEAYKNMASSEKLDVLAYLLSDGTDIGIVEELELLPLLTGKWMTFRRSDEPIFLCSENVKKILPGLEQKLLIETSDLALPLAENLQNLCSLGIFQVRDMTTATLIDLLEETLKLHIGYSDSCQLTLLTSLTAEWLYDVWYYILSLEKKELDKFKTVKIVPALREGTWKEPRCIDLLRLSDIMLVKSSIEDKLSDGVCRCFEMLHVNVLHSLPEWIPPDSVLSYFYWPTQKSVIALLSKIGLSGDLKQTTSVFNSSCDRSSKQDLVSFFLKCQYEITSEARTVIKGLYLFRMVKYIKEFGTEGSVLDCPRFIFGTECFPENIALPFPCIVIDGEYENLMKNLGGRRVLLDELVIEVLKEFEKTNNQNTEYIGRFMDYLVKNFHLFRNNPAVSKYARNTPFLKTSEVSPTYKASQLFDPSNAIIEDLLYGESLIPETDQLFNEEVIGTLKCFGLKCQSNIDADVLLKVAMSLNTWAKGKSKNISYTRKATAFMEQLMSKPSLLDDRCSNGQHLKACLEPLSCIPVKSTLPAQYPNCLKWYKNKSELCRPIDAKEVSMCLLIGATMPTVVCNSDTVNKVFKWKRPPKLEKVVDQLQTVRECYSEKGRSDLMQSIKAIFNYMSANQEAISRFRTIFIEKELLWTGENFVSADRVTLKSCTDDIDLCPYFYKLPSEYATFQSLFSMLGCRAEQDRTVLQEALHQIKLKHSKPQQKELVSRDRRMVCAILEKIANLITEQGVPVNESDMLMMVEDKCANTIKLHSVLECTYDDDPACFSELGDNVFLVHELIPYTIAETLGVKSVTKKAILDAEELGVEEWGQKEPLTTRIHTLLREAYTDGLSVPKELIQNADDAGASEVKFLYDERLHVESMERVLSKGMRGFQGPAFWAYNNATFSADDLKNITKLNAGTKLTDKKKIGKFGLGFSSVYNLTDLPSFVTGSNIVFFDPHEKHLGTVIRNKGAGLKYRLPNRTLVARHIDQFRPYEGIFGCKILDATGTNYNGTLFRLPLRTEEQAKESQIFKRSYTHEEMIQLLRMMIKAAGNMLLFTQNVTSIEIHHLGEKAVNATESELIYSIHKDSVRLENGIMNPVCESVLSRVPDLLQEKSSLQEVQMYNYKQTLFESCDGVLGNLIELRSKHSNMSWLVSWATGYDTSPKMYEAMSSEGVLPLCAVAVPCVNQRQVVSCSLKDAPASFYTKGHVFCFLPLPLITGLPVHINGCFAVKSDRRQLITITEDDKDSENKSWNNHLMEDALVKAHMLLLETLSCTNTDNNYMYYDLWPACCEDIVVPFKNAFYRHIIETDAKVFGGMTSWFSFKDVSFLDPTIRHGILGDLILKISSHFTIRVGKHIIDMPDYVLENIKQCNVDRIEYINSATVAESEFILVFLHNLKDGYWLDKIQERNRLIIYALGLSDKDVKAEMRRSSCIPTSPSNVLRKPMELIHPKSRVALLFSENDGRFPLNNLDFRSAFLLNKLVEIGMIDEILPWELLKDRCFTILKLAPSCTMCGFERCKQIVKYICHERVINELRRESTIFETISDIPMFPVLPKPKSWAFSWKASENTCSSDVLETKQPLCEIHESTQSIIVFAKSKQLFRQNTIDLVGIVENVADDRVFNYKNKHTDILLSELQIKDEGEIRLQSLVSQMMQLSKEYRDKRNQFKELERIHRSLFTHFERIVKKTTEIGHSLGILKTLSTVPVVLKHEELIKPSKVAFRIKHEYPPLLYKVPEHAQFRFAYTFLGVKENFTIEDILYAFDYMKQTWGRNPNADVEISNGLLMNMQNSMEESNKNYNSLKEFHERICAPDTACVLRPTKELVSENEEFEADFSMKILHKGIIPIVAERLGVKAKKRKCFEDISMGIPFGQKEKLETRIKGLLNAYPCDSSIMNELLQNADDAGATEINFVKDYRTHATNRLFDKACEPFQGPSLCVYNNSYFTTKDIEGIHNLGQGSKHHDPTKTGQYGVGFNAVYHLTDTPSFLTRGPETRDNLLIFLDPLCKHVPCADSSNPGLMCSFDGVKRNFYDHLLGFSCDILLPGNKGTIFRFPLRKIESEISSEIVDIARMDGILESFRNDMFDAILFLKNINNIKISNVTSGRLVEEYSVQVRHENKAKKKRLEFVRNVRDHAKENREIKEHILDIRPIQTVYELEVYDSENRSCRWVIVQRFGFSECVDDLEYLKKKVRSGDIGQMPLGGIAIPLMENRSDESNFVGRAFCFLPLPLRTGFPIHVNGHFALDHEARRNIGDEGYKKTWNSCLANHVIIPAWHNGLLYLQKNIQQHVLKETEWRKINQIFENYHSIFPVQDKTFGEFWNDLVYNFYHFAMQEHIHIFPCVLDTKNDFLLPNEFVNEPKTRFYISWNFVCDHCSHRMTSGVFNDIENHLLFVVKRYSGLTLGHLIEALLKSFGMKLLKTPSTIWRCMKKVVSSDIAVLTPDFVINYLKMNSACSKEKCYIVQINTAITETRYRSASNLEALVSFLRRDRHFYSRLEDLPILLTSDSVLRICTLQCPIYISEFSKLLPQSSSSFVHEEIRPLFEEAEAFKSNYFKPFRVAEFLSLLKRSMDPSIYAAGNAMNLTTDKRNDSQSISKEWLCLFYDFLLTNSLSDDFDSTLQKVPIDIEKFRRHISLFKEWSFLPCVRKNIRGITERILLPISETTHILHLDCDCLKEESGKSFKKLELPALDESAFDKCKNAATFVMTRIVAAHERPIEMLDCLVHHKRYLSISAVAPDDAINILAFFSRNLETLRETVNNNILRNKLKLLPLFLTQHESLTSVASNGKVIVLPDKIPTQGLQKWADSCNITLLKKNDSVQTLYNFLDLKSSDIDTVYAENILPTFTSIPKKFWMSHIYYLRERLMCKRSFTRCELSIIQSLSGIHFIPVRGKIKRANELYSPRIPIFACMLDTECFPPKIHLTKEWYDFLVLLGLKCSLDDELLLRFAGEIETEGRFRITEHVPDKSTKLLNSLLHNQTMWKSQTLSRLKSIRFIVPYTVPEKMNMIFHQVENAQRLICFENSISQKHEMLCWTSMPLIIEELCKQLNDTVRKQLGIFEGPTIDHVVLHCQNVCDSFKSLLNKKTTGDINEFVKIQMKRLYEYFEDSGEIDEKAISKLKCKPIVFLPGDSEIVTVNEVAIELPTSDQIKPYLYTAPIYYGQFFGLFEKLGCRQIVDFCHYARVLETIKNESGGKELTLPEKKAAKTAILLLFHPRFVSNRRARECEFLYLPNRNMIMTNTRELVVSNRKSYEERLKGKVDIQYFVGFDLLRLDIKEPDKAMFELPDHIRPRLLTEVVTESVCWSDIVEINPSIKARKIERFLHSECLAHGLYRIFKNQENKGNEKSNDTSLDEIKNRLQNVSVQQVSNLRTALHLKDKPVADTNKNKCFHTKRVDNKPFPKQVFYFQDNCHESRISMNRIQYGLTKLVLSCAGRLNVQSVVYISPILQQVENPDMIPSVLDDLDVKQYTSTQTEQVEHFPEPGTSVDPKFFPFLEQGILPFKDYEYESVAMDLDDSVRDVETDDPVYIYVQIICEISPQDCNNLSRVYVVNTGNPNIVSENVPIYRLFRFVRKREEPGNEMQRYGDEPVSTVPFDKCCRRIRDDLTEAWNLSEEDRKRITRRLYLKWYPDRNPDNKDYCTKVFMYIKICISRLENKEIPDTDVNSELSRGPSNVSPSSCYYANVNRRAKAYVQAYNNNIKEYKLSHNNGRYFHASVARAKRKDITEANRWLRQAKCDFLAAKTFFSVADEISGYNWICYTCHQTCEKALKSAYYAKDADNVPKGNEGHSLSNLASDRNMREQARLLEDRLGDHTKLRYPDALSRPKTPSDLFTKEDAEFSLNVAERMVNLVAEYIS